MTPIERMSIYTRAVSSALNGSLSENDRKLFAETFPDRIEQLEALNDAAPVGNLPASPITTRPSAPVHVDVEGMEDAVKQIVDHVRRAGYPI